MFGAHPMLRTGGAVSYSVPYSLRFRASNSAYLSRTPASSSSQTTYTFSYWFKRGNLNAQQQHFAVGTNSQNYFALGFGFLSGNDQLDVVWASSNVVTARRQTNRVFRDPSAWYHVVVALDTGNATANSRVRVYVNGVEETSFANSVNPTQSSNQHGWNTNVANYIGAGLPTYGQYHDGYMAEVNFIDGQALTPSSFGQTDSATGVWVPKQYAGTYGNNGFYLKFADASAATATAIGKDSSGNGNNWTPSGISVTSGVTYDQMTDTPTLNYAVLSPLDKSSVVTFQYSTLGITGGSAGGGDSFSQTAMTFGLPTTGKWYLEFKRDTAGSDANGIGVNITRTNRGGNGWPATRGISGYTGYYAFEYGFNITHDIASNNLTYRNNNVALNTYSTASTASSAIYGFAVDCDSSLVYMYENGVLLTASGGLSFTHPGGQAVIALFKSDLVASINCGQRPFSYTPPTGFKALNTANLPTPSIKKGDTYFDAELYTGNGTSQSVTGYGFQPDLVWIKGRNYVSNHRLSDAVRGVNNSLIANSTAAQDTSSTNYVTAFNANGFSVSSGAGDVNQSTQTYVAWAWKEGVTPGFDIVSYAGDNVAGRTISHALGSTPAMMVLKSRSNARTWAVYHKNLTSAAYYLGLETTNGQLVDNTMFNSTAPTSSVFSVGTYQNTSGENYIAYLWSEIEGFSKFGSYTGNGSTDGPFVWCGFRPRFVMIKRTDTTNDWEMVDTARGAYNVNTAVLAANSSSAESAFTSGYELDVLSNGFKLRSTGVVHNASGGTYIFAAFAENPFKYARAR